MTGLSGSFPSAFLSLKKKKKSIFFRQRDSRWKWKKIFFHRNPLRPRTKEREIQQQHPVCVRRGCTGGRKKSLNSSGGCSPPDLLILRPSLRAFWAKKRQKTEGLHPMIDLTFRDISPSWHTSKTCQCTSSPCFGLILPDRPPELAALRQ